jgi:hypothetical protein
MPLPNNRMQWASYVLAGSGLTYGVIDQGELLEVLFEAGGQIGSLTIIGFFVAPGLTRL